MSEQRTEEWFKERLGKVTASKISDVVARTKTGWGASRANYESQLIVERLTGKPADNYTNAVMQWGTDTEPQARNAYAFFQKLPVEECSFFPHPTIEMSGASPDGLVGESGLLEVKCPNSATHIDTLLGAPIEKKYLLQMQWQMACANRAWCDFVSFDPRFPINLQLKVIRVERDNDLIVSLENEVREFLSEVSKKVESLRNIKEFT
jgi:putative phage-type endonuclease